MPHQGALLNFPGQESNETIFIYTRRYALAFLPIFLMIFLMAILGMLIILFLNNFLPYNVIVFLGSGFLLFTLLFTLVEFFDFYFDVYIVTDRRVVTIRQERLFNRTIDQLLFEDVQDVEARSKGFFETIFSYGDVSIQTAGAKPNFTFAQVAHPNEISAIILDLSDQQTRGIPETERHPEGPVAAVINDRLIPHTPDHQNEI